MLNIKHPAKVPNPALLSEKEKCLPINLTVEKLWSGTQHREQGEKNAGYFFFKLPHQISL